MSRDPYLVQSVLHAAKVLEAFSSDEETLRLREVIARTGLSRGIVFRLLYTLERASLFCVRERTSTARICADARPASSKSAMRLRAPEIVFPRT